VKKDGTLINENFIKQIGTYNKKLWGGF